MNKKDLDGKYSWTMGDVEDFLTSLEEESIPSPTNIINDDAPATPSTHPNDISCEDGKDNDVENMDHTEETDLSDNSYEQEPVENSLGNHNKSETKGPTMKISENMENEMLGGGARSTTPKETNNKALKVNRDALGFPPTNSNPVEDNANNEDAIDIKDQENDANDTPDDTDDVNTETVDECVHRLLLEIVDKDDNAYLEKFDAIIQAIADIDVIQFMDYTLNDLISFLSDFSYADLPVFEFVQMLHSTWDEIYDPSCDENSATTIEDNI